MADIDLTLPEDTNEFDFQGQTYSANDSFETNDPCTAIAFYNAAAVANPKMGRGNKSPNAWKFIDSECNAILSADAVNSTSGIPVENPVNEDNSTLQGAPKKPADDVVNAKTKENQEDFIPPTEEPERPEDKKPHPDISDEKSQESTQSADPVDLFSGAFYLSESDLTIPNTVIPMEFTRVYRSGIAAFGPFGWNWDHNFNIYLRELINGDIAVWRNLHEDIFNFDGNEWEPPRGVFEQIKRMPGMGVSYEIYGPGGVTLHFAHPPGWLDPERIPINHITDRYGNKMTFTYDGAGHLSKVEDDDGRYFQFSYDECELLVEVQDHTKRSFHYEHNEETKHLQCVISPPITDFPEGLVRIYYYEDPWSHQKLRHNITRIEDGEGNIYLENSYVQDPGAWNFSRVKEQLYGGYLYQFCHKELQYVTPNPLFVNIPSVQVQVMNPDYGLETYTFNYRGDLLDQRYRLNKDLSFRIVAWEHQYDSQGNRISTTRPDGSQELWTYDDLNKDPRMRRNLLKKELTSASGFPSPSRIIWRGTYEPTYQLLISEKNELLAETKYLYDFQVTPANPNNAGNLLQIQYPDVPLPDGNIQKSELRLGYNPKGQLTDIALPDGTVHQFFYGNTGNEKSRLIKQSFDVHGIQINHTIEYDQIGHMMKQTDGNSYLNQQQFNDLGLLEKYIPPAVGSTSGAYEIHYNSDRQVTAYHKPCGSYNEPGWGNTFITDEFERDVLGYPVKINLGSNTATSRTIAICNDFRGLPVHVENPDGSVIKKEYDERGLLLTQTIKGNDNNQLTINNVYDRFGRIIKETNIYGLTTEYEYDGFSRISKVTLPNNSVISRTWVTGDLLSSEQITGDDGNGNVRQLSFSSYEYDIKGRMIRSIQNHFTDDPGNFKSLSTTFYYDKMDRLEKIVDPRGGTSQYKYDGMGRMILMTDPVGNEERLFYDKNDNILTHEFVDIHENGTKSHHSQEYKYDARNRLTAIKEKDGATHSFEYDERNIVTRETDPLGTVLLYEYDAFNAKIKEVHDADGLNITHRWKRDSLSRIISYIDPAGQISVYRRDDLGRTLRTNYPNGFSSLKEYNDKNLVVNETLGSGINLDYHYDIGNRISKVSNTTPSHVINSPDQLYYYDGLDRMVKGISGQEVITRRYDSLNRMVFESSQNASFERRYDDLAGYFDQIWPDGRMERHSTNANGVPVSIKEISPGSLGNHFTELAKIKHSGPHHLDQISLQKNISILNKYDDRKRLVHTEINSSSGHQTHLDSRYDRADRKRIEAISGSSSSIKLHSFDPKSRLIRTQEGFNFSLPSVQDQSDHDNTISNIINAAASAQKEKTWVYNAGDERTKMAATGHPDKNYTYDTGHKIKSDGNNNYTHDLDGNLNSDGILEFKTDAFGRVVKILSGSKILCEISYDAVGRPVAIKENSQPIKTLFYFGKWLQQENVGNNIKKQITQNSGTGVPLAYHVPGDTLSPVFDGRYNLIELLDGKGNLVEYYRYSEFGEPSIFDPSGNSRSRSKYGIEPRFGGQRYLNDIGMYLSKRRIMNPKNGIFLTADMYGYADSPSLYVYVGQDPIDYIDPDGELGILAGLLIAAAVGATVGAILNASRQGIAIAEGSQEEWEWGQFATSIGMGAVAGPLLVVAPELAVPLAIYGVGQGAKGISEGRYATGAFDIVTSVAPFGAKGVRGATIGKGSYIGKVTGKGPAYSMSTRANRFKLIGKAAENYVRPIGGRKIGVGIARKPGETEGHVAVTAEQSKGKPTFFERNAMRSEDKSLVSFYNTLETPPEVYNPFPWQPRKNPPSFEYSQIKVPASKVTRAGNYAKTRISKNHLSEPFNFKCSNCSHFVADVISEAGFRDFGTNTGAGVYNNFVNFGSARTMGWHGPVISSAVVQPNDLIKSK